MTRLRLLRRVLGWLFLTIGTLSVGACAITDYHGWEYQGKTTHIVVAVNAIIVDRTPATTPTGWRTIPNIGCINGLANLNPRFSANQIVLPFFHCGFTTLLLGACFILPDAIATIRFHRRRAEGRCLRCGYNLTGNTTGVCPECGKAVTLVINPPNTVASIKSRRSL